MSEPGASSLLRLLVDEAIRSGERAVEHGESEGPHLAALERLLCFYLFGPGPSPVQGTPAASPSCVELPLSASAAASGPSGRAQRAAGERRR